MKLTFLFAISVYILTSSFTWHTFYTLIHHQMKEYREDPLIHRGSVILNMGIQLLYMVEEVEKIVPDVNFPFLVLHGADDEMTYADGARKLHKSACSKDKSIKVLYH